MDVLASIKTDTIFQIFVSISMIFGLECEWHFFATSHGKSSCDGIGETVKRSVTRTSLHRTLERQMITPIDMLNIF